MEAAAEKMAALKEVYAETILNMAKESAARVLEAERRAARFQRGVAATKDEAIAALLRLKAVMDCKLKEAETTSMGQVRRIQELEAQLNEAEDVICSLRSDLNIANNELEMLKNNITDPLNRHNANDHVVFSIEEGQGNKPSSDTVNTSVGSRHMLTFDPTSATIDNHCCSIEDTKQTEPSKNLSAESESTGNPDLASIILCSKEPELYRNGCTQRIRAFEQNMSVGPNDDKLRVLNKESEEPTFERGTDESPCRSSETAEKNVCVEVNPIESEETLQHASSFANNHILMFSGSVVTRRKRGKRNHIKPIISSKLLDEPSDAMSSRSEDIKTSPHLSLKSGNSRLLKCSTAIETKENVTKKSHPHIENPISQSPPSNPENNNGQERATDPTGKNAGISTGSVENDVNNTLRVFSIATPEQHSTETSHNGFCRKSEASDAPIAHSDVKDGKKFGSNGPAQSDKNRFLKYFQRKRKRGASSSENDSVMLEGGVTGENKKALLEPQKSSIEMELPRNSRRLAQVARQLVSLSERRW